MTKKRQFVPIPMGEQIILRLTRALADMDDSADMDDLSRFLTSWIRGDINTEMDVRGGMLDSLDNLTKTIGQIKRGLV